MDLVDLATRYMHVWKGVLDALGDENVTRMALRSVGSVALRDETPMKVEGRRHDVEAWVRVETEYGDVRKEISGDLLLASQVCCREHR